MTALKIIEKIAAMPNGAILTTENRHSQQYLLTVLNTFRGELAKQLYIKDGMIHPDYYQKFYCEYNSDLQDSTVCVKFACPPSISLDGKSDGFRYAGTEDCSNNYPRIMSRGQLSNFNNHKIMNVFAKRFFSVYYDGSEKIWEAYGNMDLRELMAEGLFGEPTLIPRYNFEFDNYPIPENDIALLEEIIYAKNTGISTRTQPDYLPNAVDDSGTQQPNTRRK